MYDGILCLLNWLYHLAETLMAVPEGLKIKEHLVPLPSFSYCINTEPFFLYTNMTEHNTTNEQFERLTSELDTSRDKAARYNGTSLKITADPSIEKTMSFVVE